MFGKVRAAIKAQETPVTRLLYKAVMMSRSISVPVIKPLHHFLYNEWVTRRSIWHSFWRVVYYEPMFKSQCKEVGAGFRMEYSGNGSSIISGELDVYLGDNVRMFDNTAFQGSRVGGRSVLNVGDNTYLSPMLRIMVADRVEIGRWCIVAAKFISDNSGHPISDVMARMTSGGGSPSLKSIKPITIGDFCFLGNQSVIYPGSVVGDGVVAQFGTHVKGRVPPFTLVGGNPMRIVGKLPIPAEIRNFVGDKRYQEYLEAHAKLDI